MSEIPKQGDYVFATKYSDGDPSDQWCVGFYDGFRHDRHFVVDGDGKQFRGNGFRKAAKITAEEGVWLLDVGPRLEGSPPGVNLWDMLAARAP
jgi:hypothetical protein